jgi:hypothetical protein
MAKKFLRIVLAGCLLGGLMLLLLPVAFGGAAAPALDEGLAAVPLSTADHSRFKELDRPFTSGPEVTRACLKCHNRAAEQVEKSLHWTWEAPDEKGKKVLGKAHVLNNY